MQHLILHHEKDHFGKSLSAVFLHDIEGDAAAQWVSHGFDKRVLDFSCLALSLAVRTVAGRGRVIEVVSHFPSPSLPQLAGLSLKINMAADRSHESKLKRMGEARRRRVRAVLGGMIPLSVAREDVRAL